jgi:GNAT superfamily N-acetyltransferase
MASIRALAPDDELEPFSSGSAILDAFLKRYARKNQVELKIGATYVAVEEKRILGFVTIAAGDLEFENLPVAARKGFPKYPLPILRLARLAIDRFAQGKGLASALVRFVFERAIEMSRQYGCGGVLVDAKPDAVSFYRKFGFAPIGLALGEAAASPRPIPLFLPMRQIETALTD